MENNIQQIQQKKFLIPVGTIKKIKHAAIDLGCTESEIAAKAIESYLEKISVSDRSNQAA